MQIGKAQIVSFLIDLASPIGPEVFAGFGTELQNKRHEWQTSGDGLSGLFEEELRVDGIIQEWAAGVEVEHTLLMLFDIVHNGPSDELGESLRRRRREDWDFSLVRLISAVGSRDQELLNAIVDTHRHCADVSEIAADAIERINDEHNKLSAPK